ncbi:MAG: SlyX family protein [Pseudomonadales bacterium]
MIDQQIVLETKIAFLEKNVAELSDALYRQHQQIEKLGKELDKMSEQLKSFTGEVGIDPAFEKPPHY